MRLFLFPDDSAQALDALTAYGTCGHDDADIGIRNVESFIQTFTCNQNPDMTAAEVPERGPADIR